MKVSFSDPQIRPDLFQQMELHAATAGNTEACGLLFKDHYVQIDNVSGDRARFAADPAQLARALSRHGEPEAVFHFHAGGNLVLSAEDRQQWYYVYSTLLIGSFRGGTFRCREYRLRVPSTEYYV